MDDSPVTMRHVAERAGVSTASVSRVLSGTRPVTPEVDIAVRRAAEELGYRMNHAAQSLRRQRTGVIGMVVPHITNPFFPALVDAVEQRLHDAHGWSLLLCDSHGTPDHERERLASLHRGRIDGLLIIPAHVTNSTAAVDEAAGAMPVVQVDRWSADAAADVVAMDHHGAMRAVIAHLAELDRRRIAYLGATDTDSAAEQRHAGVVEAADDHGLTLVTTLTGEYTARFGEAGARRLLDDGPVPDAIVCGNDLIALGVLRALVHAGVAVPDDVAITGVDGIIFADLTTPRLTTVVQPVDAIGATAVERLVARIDGEESGPTRELLPGTLRVGPSTLDPVAPAPDDRGVA